MKLLNKEFRRLCLIALPLITWISTQEGFCAQPETNRTILNPYQLNARARGYLEANKKKQVEAAMNSRAFHDFQFSDRLTESNIRFEHRVVEDAAKTWKPAHYDHGTAVAVADVDGDG